MEKNVEIEMKLVINKRDLKKFLSSELFLQAVREGSAKQRRLISTYYDTAELALKQRGIAYRVRDKGDGSFEATVKTAQKSSGGLSQRLELNLPLTENKPCLEGFGQLGLGYELTELAPEGVEALFTVEVDRTTYLLDLPGAVVELALDQGKITSPRQKRAKDPIAEVELELLEGELAPLVDYVAQMAELVPVFVEKRSKFARGLALLGFATEEQSTRVKVDMQANVRQQLLLLVQQRCDNLLLLQNSLVQKVESEQVKDLQKQVGYLVSYLELGQALAQAPQLEKARVVAEQTKALAKKIQNLAKLTEIWREAQKKGGALVKNNVISKKLLAEEEQAKEELALFAREGQLSVLAYQALSWLQLQPWKNEEYLELASLARYSFKTWEEAREAAATEAEALESLYNIYYLAKTLPGKEYAKLAEAAKKERKKCLETVEQEELVTLAEGLAHGSNSRVLTRDVGVVMGWLWATK